MPQWLVCGWVTEEVRACVLDRITGELSETGHRDLARSLFTVVEETDQQLFPLISTGRQPFSQAGIAQFDPQHFPQRRSSDDHDGLF